ncbi:MAG: sigma-70 family RNA polymerase sigma factor [Bacteroidota bacterium]
MSKEYGKSKGIKLWEAFVKGDTKAFEMLYEVYFPKLVISAYQSCENIETARDIVQEVFERLLLGYPDYPKVYDFEVWIKRKVKNACLRRIEETQKRQKIVDELVDSSDSKPSEVASNFDYELLRARIRTLQGKYFTIILEMVLDGYSNAEIALTIGKSEKYVRDRKFLAGKRLKEVMIGKKEVPITPPIDLYFDLGEHSPDDISQIIMYIDTLYKELGGDEIIIEKPNLIDLFDTLIPDGPVTA